MSEPRIVAVPDASAAGPAAAGIIVDVLARAVAARARADIATTGGSTPAGIYRALATPPHRGRLPWNETHVWWGDERFVPREHELSNVKPLDDVLLRDGAAPLPRANIHPFPVSRTLAAGEDEAWCAAELTGELHGAGLATQEGWPVFDLVLLGHYHALQKVSKRTWYAGSTDTFSFADSPETPKGLVVVDTDTGSVEHVENPHERPLATVGISADGLSAGELVDAVEKAAAGTPSGAIVRAYLNGVDPASFRQVANEQFQEAVPAALWVQVEPDYGAEAFAVQGGPVVGSLEQEWAAYVEPQDLAGLDRERVVALGSRFLVDAQEETV